MQVDTVGVLIPMLRLLYSLTTFTPQACLSKNIFNDLPDLAPTAADYRDELECYLVIDIMMY